MIKKKITGENQVINDAISLMPFVYKERMLKGAANNPA